MEIDKKHFKVLYLQSQYLSEEFEFVKELFAEFRIEYMSAITDYTEGKEKIIKDVFKLKNDASGMFEEPEIEKLSTNGIKKLYKKIVSETHPDTFVNKGYSKKHERYLEEMYKKAAYANKIGDIARMINIAKMLDINEFVPTLNDIQQIDEFNKELTKKIQSIKSNAIWQYGVGDDTMKHTILEMVTE